MKHPSLTLLALMAAIPAPALAQDILLQGIVVSASLEETEASRTGASVSLLSEEDLQASDIALADNLARLPGLSYSRSGGLGATSKLRIRGLGGEHIAVRIDGLDVADPSATQTAFDFGGLATGGLSRVEVLRGSQSALYGSEAVAGVVDIRSFRPTDQGVSGVASIETGSNSTWSGNLSSGLLTDRAELAFTVTRTITDGISSAASGTERDSFASTFATLYGAFDLTEAAMAARARFSRAADAMGPELSGVAIDVCCFEKGLEVVERERQWPARSAKLLLRAALLSLARHYAPPPSRASRTSHHWGEEDYRPPMAAMTLTR